VSKSAQTAEALRNIVEATTGVINVAVNISNEQAKETDKIQNSMEIIYQGDG